LRAFSLYGKTSLRYERAETELVVY